MPTTDPRFDIDEFLSSCVGQPLEQIVARLNAAVDLHEQVKRQPPANQAKFVGSEAFAAFAQSLLYFLVLAPGEEPPDMAPTDLARSEPLIAHLVGRGDVPPAVGRWLKRRAPHAA